MVFRSRARNGLVLALVPLLAAAGTTAASAAPRPSGPAETSIRGFQTAAGSVLVGGAIADVVTVVPRAARTILVQSRRVGARFATVSTGRTSAQGNFLAQLKPPARGSWQFRVVLPATSGGDRRIARQINSLR